MYMHLKLYHGRTDPEATMSDWGTDGPEIGPLESVQGTYATDLKLRFVNPSDALTFNLDPHFPCLEYKEDIIFYAGVYYGDFLVFTK